MTKATAYHNNAADYFVVAVRLRVDRLPAVFNRSPLGHVLDQGLYSRLIHPASLPVAPATVTTPNICMKLIQAGAMVAPAAMYGVVNAQISTLPLGYDAIKPGNAASA